MTVLTGSNFGSALLPVVMTTALYVFSISSAAQAQDAKQIDASNVSINTVGLTQTELDDGWIALFDKATLFGWRKATDADWKVDEGAICVGEGEKGLLRTASQFDDFELKVEFKITASTNSGIFIRTSPQPIDPTGDCIEVNLANPRMSDFPTGALVNRKRRSDIDDDDPEWFAKWHEAHIVAKGPNIRVKIDGQETVDYTDPAGEESIGRGYIGIQYNGASAKFRSVRLKPLNVTSIFNGKDLSGWNTDQKLKSEFVVSEQKELQIRSGRGQIESTDRYANFIFSMKCRTNAKGLNSGVFFRCIPGQLMNGYESQIQNQVKNSDRSKPVDCGTGGIFRRTQARRVNADDQKWFTKTIVATGPHIAVWVNGFQVTDWSDKRKPDANPRKGRRLKAGTLIFQGHDPTTDILLKDIRAREVKPRNR